MRENEEKTKEMTENDNNEKGSQDDEKNKEMKATKETQDKTHNQTIALRIKTINTIREEEHETKKYMFGNH